MPSFCPLNLEAFARSMNLNGSLWLLTSKDRSALNALLLCLDASFFTHSGGCATYYTCAKHMPQLSAPHSKDILGNLTSQRETCNETTLISLFLCKSDRARGTEEEDDSRIKLSG
jgi:hypothetical protein